jgi:hypothetical protein
LVTAGSGAYSIPGTCPDFDVRRGLLQHLLALGFTENVGSSWKLTVRGLNAIEIGIPLCDPQPIFTSRSHALKDLEMFELLAALQGAGWEPKCTLTTSSKKAIQKLDYLAGQPKAFYWHAPGFTLTKEYLILLLDYEKHKKPVPHLAHARVYAALLDNKIVAPERKGRVLKSAPCMSMNEGDEWLDMEAFVPRRPKAKRRPSKRRRIVDDGGGSGDAVEDDIDGESGESGESSGSDASESDAVPVACGEDRPERARWFTT